MENDTPNARATAIWTKVEALLEEGLKGGDPEGEELDLARDRAWVAILDAVMDCAHRGARIIELEADLAGAIQRAGTAEHRVAELLREANLREAERSTLEADRNAAREEAEDARGERNAALEALRQLDHVDTRILGLKSDLAGAIQRAGTAEHRVAEIIAERDELREQLDATLSTGENLLAARNAAKAECNTLEAECNRLRSALDAVTDERDKSLSLQEDLHRAALDLAREQNEMQAEGERLKAELAEQNEACATLERAAADNRKDMMGMAIALDKANLRASRAEASVEAQRATIERLRSEIRKANAELIRLRPETREDRIGRAVAELANRLGPAFTVSHIEDEGTVEVILTIDEDKVPTIDLRVIDCEDED